MTIEDVGESQNGERAAEVVLIPNRKLDGITVLDGSEVVWRSPRGVVTQRNATVRPGQTIKVTAVWNGRPNQASVKSLSPGAYTLIAVEDGLVAASTITIQGR
jgi:hypothetical protein